MGDRIDVSALATQVVNHLHATGMWSDLIDSVRPPVVSRWDVSSEPDLLPPDNRDDWEPFAVLDGRLLWRRPVSP